MSLLRTHPGLSSAGPSLRPRRRLSHRRYDHGEIRASPDPFSGSQGSPFWGLPQFLGHLGAAPIGRTARQPRREALAILDADVDREALRAAARSLFGPDADPDLVTDARAVFADAIAGATRARFASLPGGESSWSRSSPAL